MVNDNTVVGAFSQFGFELEQGTERICVGLGSHYHRQSQMPPFVMPTKTFDDKINIELAGRFYETNFCARAVCFQYEKRFF